MKTGLVLLLALGGQQGDGAIETARRLVEERRPLEAIRILDEARRRDPTDPAIHHELGLLFAALGRTGQALEAMGQAAKLAPEETSYALDFGELLYRSGRAEEALPYLEQASSIPEALLLLSGVHEKLGNEDRTIALLANFVESKPEEIEARRLLGEKLEKVKRIDEALDVYRAGLEGESPSPFLLERVAELLSRNRDSYSEAEEYARRALEASPEMLEARLVLARILSRTGRESEALSELERARDAHPDASHVYYNLAQSYQRAGRDEEAQSAAETFRELSMAEQEASEREARVAVTYKQAAELLRDGNMLEAERSFLSVLDIDPENTQARSMLAKIAFSKGDTASAKRWIDEALKRNATIAEHHYLRALFELRAGARTEAAPSLRRALELDPAFPDAWSLLGTLLLDSGQDEEAVECFARAAALEPENAAIQLNLASAYAALGNEAEEERAMERYRELSQKR